ncbi:MAG: hypothetical protein R3F19_19635 [Verrucomicrobiales bacterium]
MAELSMAVKIALKFLLVEVVLDGDLNAGVTEEPLFCDYGHSCLASASAAMMGC